MKNKYLLLNCVVFCIACFLNNWFKDEIFEKAGILFLVLDFILLGSFFWLLRKIRLNGKNSFMVLPVAILFLTVLLSFSDFRLIKAKLELPLYMKERMKIIEMVKEDHLGKNDPNVALQKHKYISRTGEIYVYENDEEQVIGFWIFRGMMSGSVKVVYSSEGEKLIRQNEADIIQLEKLREHWYYIVESG